MYGAFNYTRLAGTAAGTTQIFTGSKNFQGILIGQAKTGTVTFYDNVSSGTSDASLLFAFDNNVNAGNLPSNLEVNAAMKKGLVAVVGGTTDVFIKWN